MGTKFFTKYRDEGESRRFKSADWQEYWSSLTEGERQSLRSKADWEHMSLSAVAIEWGAVEPEPDIAPPTNGTDTSAAAARSIRPDAATLRDQVLDIIRKSPNGKTTDEIEQELQIAHQTISPRVWELHRRSLIGDSGQRRKTRSGRLAIVYRALTAEEIAKKVRHDAVEGRAQLTFPFPEGASK